jgi:hypothetical protein
MEQQGQQQPDIVKNVTGVLMLIPSIGIPIFFASVGIRIAGFLFSVAGTVLGSAAQIVGNIVSGPARPMMAPKPPLRVS